MLPCVLLNNYIQRIWNIWRPQIGLSWDEATGSRGYFKGRTLQARVLAQKCQSSFRRGLVNSCRYCFRLVKLTCSRDTVSSIGIVRGKQMLPRTVDGMKHVCYFRQALALDERRVKFLPEFAYGGDTIKHDQASEPQSSQESLFKDYSSRSSTPTSKSSCDVLSSQTKEVWFAGTHSDMCVQLI